MKKFLVISYVVVMLSCNSNGEGENFGDTTGANMPGIENVNGNIPDTSNAIAIDDTIGTLPGDTAR
jgi:hypothetical protein